MDSIEELPKKMNVKIKKTIHVGYAGTPFHVEIDVDYEKQDNNIIVTYCMEDSSPYDNPPDVWYGQIKDAVEDYFYDQDKNLNVSFK